VKNLIDVADLGAEETTRRLKPLKSPKRNGKAEPQKNVQLYYVAGISVDFRQTRRLGDLDDH